MKIFKEIIANWYSKVFYVNWSIGTAGVLIGITSVLVFAWERPWGVAGGLKDLGDTFFYMIGIYANKPNSPFFSTSSILTIGLFWGAFASALMSKQFILRKAPTVEIVKGIIGGSIMGTGAAMAKGCNIGGFYVAMSAMSLGGLCMMVGLFVGAYIGIRYLYWELEHYPSSHIQKSRKKNKTRFLKIQPYLGTIVLILAFITMIIYSQNAYTKLGGLLLFGIAFGIIMHRSRFCFVRFFRDPFMSGEADMIRTVSISLMISIIGFAILKWTGLRDEMVYVTKSFWIGGFIGGIVFGFGMVISGGCGSGSIWRAAEGHLKLIFCVIFFALTTSLVNKIIKASPELNQLMGYRVFLPDYLTYGWSLILLIGLLCFLSLIFTWNERTEKFTIDI